MAQYIDKSAVVAEIERKKIYAQTLGDNAINSSMQQFYDGMREGCNNLLNFLNTLEGKELDLERALDNFYKQEDWFPTDAIEYDTHKYIARHFFELGLKVQKGE